MSLTALCDSLSAQTGPFLAAFGSSVTWTTAAGVSSTIAAIVDGPMVDESFSQSGETTLARRAVIETTASAVGEDPSRGYVTISAVEYVCVAVEAREHGWVRLNCIERRFVEAGARVEE